MKHFFRTLLLIPVLLFSFSLTVPAAYAATDPFEVACDVPSGNGTPEFCQQANEATSNANANTGLLGQNGLLAKIIQTLIFIIAGVSLIVIIIGGLRYVLSGGDANGVQAAKNTILYALVGFVISLFAQVIVTFVINRL